jgi:hypothetical protein
MMHKRTLYSLLIVSFIAVFASVAIAQDGVEVVDQLGLKKCVQWETDIVVNVDQSMGDISAFEIVLDVSKVSGTCADVIEDVTVEWDESFTALPEREDFDVSDYPMIRIAAMTLGDPAQYLGPGSHVVAQIMFTTDECCDAEALIDGAQIDPGEPFGIIQTQFVDAATGGLRPAEVTSGTITVANRVPVFTDESIDETLTFGDVYSHTFTATDADAVCETKTFYAVGELPAGMSLNGSTGELIFNTTAENICFDGNIVIGVRDKCNATDVNTGTVHFCVMNNPPTFTAVAPATNDITWGTVFTFDFDANDPDPGPYGPIFETDGPGVIDPNTGVYTWDTYAEEPFGGSFDITVRVNDGAPICDPCSPVNSEEYTFTINVMILDRVVITKEEHVFLGQPRDVFIDVTDESFFGAPIGGFDFLIQYDPSVMMFMSADRGDFLVNCEWEYFTYRFGANGNCGPGACPSGILRVVAMAESTGGNLAHHPLCQWLVPHTRLVVLHFMVSSDATLECNFAPIRWIWYDCADNSFSDSTGQFLYISQKVFDFAGFVGGDPVYSEITGLDNTFPTLTGAPFIDDCDMPLPEFPTKAPTRMIHFRNGGLDLECADSIDAVGDINMNAIGYEIADAVMFTNYFLEGIGAFGSHPEGSIAASDTNQDGLTLTVADLVYMIRVIIGDALPYAKVGTMERNWTQDAGVVAIDGEVGGATLVVDGNVTPQLLVSGMTMESRFDGQVTRIVVIPDVEAGAMNSFNGAFLGGIDHEVIAIDAATPEGQMIALKNVPTDYELSQNYPNPFNPTTKISVSLKQAGDYALTIYNVQGQVVQVISGSVAGPERVEITWDASSLASGVYFYKLTAGNFTDTKKAVFLK